MKNVSCVNLLLLIIWIITLAQEGLCRLDGTCSEDGVCAAEPNADTCDHTPPECVCNINFKLDNPGTGCVRRTCVPGIDNPSIRCGEKTACSTANVCGCIANFVESGLECVQKTCTSDVDCFFHNSYCERNRCVCKKNYEGYNTTECVMTSCSKNEQCQEANSYCDSSANVCKCGSIATAEANSGACLRKSCTLENTAAICGSNAYCELENSTCSCNVNHRPVKDHCVRKSCVRDGNLNCDANSFCEGGFCKCRTGFSEATVECLDIDECATSPCHATNATCTNTFGSYICECNSGYVGDGFTCDAINCSHYDIIFVVDTSLSKEGYNISQIKNAAIPLALQAPRILPSLPRTARGYDSKDVLRQIYDSMQAKLKTPLAVGIGEYKSFASEFIYGRVQNGNNLVGIYETDNVNSLLHIASSLIRGMKKRLLESPAYFTANSWCHPEASCSVRNSKLKCECKAGLVGDGFKCEEAFWDGWEEWSTCSSSCSPGIQMRQRFLLPNINASAMLMNETRPCNQDLCNKYSENKLSCIGEGKIPIACKLSAMVERRSNLRIIPGTTEEFYESADKKMKITKFKSPGMKLKIINIDNKEKN